MVKKLRNIHAGEILLTEFMEPLSLSQNKVAKEIGVSPRRINEIVNGQRAITSETGLLLDRYFGMSQGFFSGLQGQYDIEEVKDRLEKRLKAIKPVKMRHLEVYAQ
jgi:antitoxin HigA-1